MGCFRLIREKKWRKKGITYRKLEGKKIKNWREKGGLNKCSYP